MSIMTYFTICKNSPTCKQIADALKEPFIFKHVTNVTPLGIDGIHCKVEDVKIDAHNALCITAAEDDVSTCYDKKIFEKNIMKHNMQASPIKIIFNGKKCYIIAIENSFHSFIYFCDKETAKKIKTANKRSIKRQA